MLVNRGGKGSGMLITCEQLFFSFFLSEILTNCGWCAIITDRKGRGPERIDMRLCEMKFEQKDAAFAYAITLMKRDRIQGKEFVYQISRHYFRDPVEFRKAKIKVHCPYWTIERRGTHD